MDGTIGRDEHDKEAKRLSELCRSSIGGPRKQSDGDYQL